MKIIIDRFEGDWAVCEQENQEMVHIEKARIPIEAKPGDVLIINGHGIITLDKEETKSRKKRIEKLMEDIWE